MKRSKKLWETIFHCSAFSISMAPLTKVTNWEPLDSGCHQSFHFKETLTNTTNHSDFFRRSWYAFSLNLEQKTWHIFTILPIIRVSSFPVNEYYTIVNSLVFLVCLHMMLLFSVECCASCVCIQIIVYIFYNIKIEDKNITPQYDQILPERQSGILFEFKRK